MQTYVSELELGCLEKEDLTLLTFLLLSALTEKSQMLWIKI